MNIERAIHYVDTHTAGEPTRIVVGGLPPIRGNNMREKGEYVRRNFDFIRTAIMQEPRGHRDMFGSLITPPSDVNADIGVIWIDCYGYADMCGHATMGVATWAVELGIVEVEEPITEVKLDTPAGLVTADVQTENGRVESVTMRNVPSFHYQSTKIDVPGIGEIPVDVSFGGNFFAIVRAEDLGLKINPENAFELRKIGVEIKHLTNQRVKVQHPEISSINFVWGVRIVDEPAHLMADHKIVNIFAEGELDRSVGGTATCAHIATLYSNDRIKLGEDSVHENMMGVSWTGRAIEETMVGPIKAVTTELTGNAYIIGTGSMLIDPKDPLKHGFLI